jgi:hypothetical protein
MADFSSGVMKYIKARATVEVGFPVDWRGNAEIACKHCKFYVRATQRCGLNQEIVNFPERFIGEFCPLEEVIEDGREYGSKDT